MKNNIIKVFTCALFCLIFILSGCRKDPKEFIQTDGAGTGSIQIPSPIGQPIESEGSSESVGAGGAEKETPVQQEENIVEEKKDTDLVTASDGSKLKAPFLEQNDGDKTLQLFDTFTSASSDITNKRYEDSQGNRYSYDGESNLIGYHPKTPIPNATKLSCTKDNAQKIAEPFIKTFCGEDFAKFTFSYTRYDETHKEYAVVYKEMITDDIVGEEVSAILQDDGALVSVARPFNGETEGFEQSKAQNLNKEKLEAYLTKELNSIYGEKLEEYEMGDLLLTKKDGKFYVKIYYTAQCRDKEPVGEYHSAYSVSNEILYPL